MVDVFVMYHEDLTPVVVAFGLPNATDSRGRITIKLFFTPLTLNRQYD
jgi:hypothetical protein